ncbi:hypothetical protein Glove_311g42 [Diversispora epigaea]|uniref:Uncharacterized protein n=1 Tax=Diversispora epigaea TaxID=1348612 RepID=A0A397HSC4_9GLOM|nr:hypothetical protein Glove_311g42 [Diversispora epigaea]
MGNPQSTIDSLRELNSDLVHQIMELRKKFNEEEAENAKLKQIIKENAKCDGRVEELEQKNIKLETRLAILEQTSLVVERQPQNDKEVIPEMQLSINNTQKTLEDKETDTFLNEVHKKELVMKLGRGIGGKTSM